MSLSQSAVMIGEDLIRSLKARLELLEEMHAEVQQMLEKYNQERVEMFKKLKEVLADDRLNRIEEVNKLIDSYYADRAEAHKVWKETFTTLEKIREFNAQKKRQGSKK